MELIDLPREILFEILAFLPLCKIICLSAMCKILYSVCRDDRFWKYLCRRDFQVNYLGTFEDYYALYKWLYRYKLFFGLRELGLEAYGGLVLVEYEKGIIVGKKVSPHISDLTKPLDKSLLFCVSPDKEDLVTCFSNETEHPCVIRVQKTRGSYDLVLHCSDPDSHSRFDDIDHIDAFRLQYQLMLELKLTEGIKLSPIKDRGSLDIPDTLLDKGTLPEHLFAPGLFKGTYGSHGLELVLFTYKNNYEMHGVKVTGDPNVFAGKISVKISLNFPCRPTKEQQIDFSQLREMEPSSQDAPTHQQEFFLPPNCFDRHKVSHKSCKARYHGLGQVAFTDFTNPSFIPIQVVIFSNDEIGALFIDLNCFSLYHRIKNDEFDFAKYYNFV